MDIGTPLVVEGRAVGIMTAIVEGKRNLAVYTQLFVHNDHIKELMRSRKTHTPYTGPRKYARFDWRTFLFYADNQPPSSRQRHV